VCGGHGGGQRASAVDGGVDESGGEIEMQRKEKRLRRD